MLADSREKAAVVAQVERRLSMIHDLVRPPEDLHAQVEVVVGTASSAVSVRARDLWRDIVERVRMAQASELKRASVSRLTGLDQALGAFIDICDCSKNPQIGERIDEQLRIRVLGCMHPPCNGFDGLVKALDDVLDSVRNNPADQETTESRLKKVEQATQKLREDHNARDGQHGQYLHSLGEQFNQKIKDFEKKGNAELSGLTERANAQSEEYVAGLVQLQLGSRKLLEQLTELERLNGVGKFSESFKLRGKKMSYWAWAWLFGGVVTLGLAISTPFLLPWLYELFELPDLVFTDWSPAAFEHLGKRVVIVFALLGFSAYCLRNFRVQRNLREDYEHRQLALETFNTFKVSAHDQATKDRVLLWACRTIFSTPTSASSAKAADGMQPDPELVAKILAQLKG